MVGSRRAMARAFVMAAGTMVALCTTCDGAPYPPRVRLSTDSVCSECKGRLDEQGRPILRFSSQAEGPRKVIVLSGSCQD